MKKTLICLLVVQEYEYKIYDKDGNHLYTYSMDKMFGEMFVEKTLAPGEEYVMKLMLTISQILKKVLTN
ncbi:hypothetical protein KHA80_00215 [Anaerobacillus sp. HL2]|nr:hypothetical protein KHA80_00215 [Anaerobacillus sp. HL2]